MAQRIIQLPNADCRPAEIRVAELPREWKMEGGIMWGWVRGWGWK
jgi:hypothetical protein